MPPAVLQEVKKLEEAARASPPKAAGQHLNRAGDLCARAGDTERTKQLYGRAIDVHLRAGDYAPAAAICRKLIRVSPDVVRARCTLAFLAFGNRFPADAVRELEEYVAAVRRTGTERFAIPRLRLLAQAVDERDAQWLIAEKLDELNARDEALAVRADAERRAAEPGPDSAIDADARWRRLMEGALLEPESMWRTHWLR